MLIVFLVISSVFATISAISLIYSDNNRGMAGAGLALNLSMIADIVLDMVK